MKDSGKLRNVLLRAWLPLGLLAVWQILSQTRMLNPVLFPPPSRLLVTAWHLCASGELARHLLVSLERMAAGLAIGAFTGLLCGLLMGGVRAVRVSLEPLIAALYSTPKLTLLPIVMLLAGFGNRIGIILVATSTFSLTAVHCLDAVRNVNRTYVDLAVNYGANRRAVFLKVYLPACLPQIFTGLRLAAGRALIMTISVEMVNPSNGIGTMIVTAWQTFMTDRLFVVVAVTAAVGALLHYSLQILERRLIPWKAGEKV